MDSGHSHQTIHTPVVWNRRTLAPYKRYSKLFGERKFARKFLATPFRLLDLPAEVRNQIYREILVLEDAIELNPKSTNPEQDERTRTRRLNRYRYDIQPRLRLLRTNKQIHHEATSIYYGENEFRFTHVQGWYVLAAFLHTIGPENSKLLRSIAIHVPWFGRATCNYKVALFESKSQMGRIQATIGGMGLKYHDRYKDFQMVASVRRCKKILEASGALHMMKLILPDSYTLFPWDQNCTQYNGSMSMQEVFDPAKFSDEFQVTLVRLHGSIMHDLEDPQYRDLRRLEELRTHVDAWEWFPENCGWKMETMVHDEAGLYPVPLQEGDRILDPRT